MTVVVGYVPAPVGEAALRVGADEARRRKERLLVVNTSRGDRVADPRLISRENVEELKASVAFDVAVRRRVVDKEPWEYLIDVVEEVEASLLVIGIRRRTSVGKMIMGSNAHQILMEAPCPILSIKAPCA